MKIKKQMLSLLFSGIILVSSSVPTWAAYYPNQTSKSECDTSINSGVYVSIPKRLDLLRNETEDTYNEKNYVSAGGRISYGKVLSVQSDTLISYKNEAIDDSVDGVVTFGDNGVCTWDADEMYRSISSAIKKPIEITVDAKDVNYADKYNSVVNFKIETGIQKTDAKYFTFSVNEESHEACLTGFTELGLALENVVTPTEYNGYPVTAISLPVCSGSALKNLTVSDGVKIINEYNSYCLGVNKNSVLESVYISDSVEYIGDFTFGSIPTLKSIRLPINDNFKKIGIYTLSDTPIEDLIIPDSVETIHSSAIPVKALKTIIFPKNLKTNNSSLSNAKKIDTIIFNSENCTRSVFVNDNTSGWSNTIRNVVFSNTVKTISCNTLLGLTKSTINPSEFNVTLGENITSISNLGDIFFMKEVVLPESVKVISDRAIANSMVEKIVIPYKGNDFVFGVNAICDCANLKELVLPKISTFSANSFTPIMNTLTDIYTASSESEWNTAISTLTQTEIDKLNTLAIHYNYVYTE